jgi:hypothetical protein
MAESGLQLATAQILDLLGWLWCHVPNEGKRSKAYGGRLKAEGMKRGVPDVLIFEDYIWGKQLGHGVAIELKSESGTTTPEQRDWLDALDERGWLVSVCRTMDQVCAVLKRVNPENGRRFEG